MQNPFKKASGGFGVPGSGGNPDANDILTGYRQNTESLTSFSQRPQTFDVYVGRIPQEWPEDKMWNIFLPYGEIKSLQVKGSPDFKNGKKIAFVRYSREEDARKAVEALSWNAVGNTFLQVNMAQRGKNKDRQNNIDLGQGRKSYTDFKKNSSNMTGVYQKNERSNWSPDKRGKPRQFAKVQDPEYGGGYGYMSNLGSKQSVWNPGLNSMRNQVSQGLSAGMYGNERKDWNYNTGKQNRVILREEVVLVTEVESCVTFWGQVGVSSVARSLAESSEELQHYCPSGPKVGKAAQQNKVYGGLYPLDKLWYRCTVLEFLPQAMVKVKYVDYGNVETISQENLVELPSSLSNPMPFAHLYQLADCSSCAEPASAEETNPLAFQQLRNLISGKLVTVKVVSEGSNGVREVVVDHPGDCGRTVNDVMIAGGCVQRRKRSDGGIIERSVAEKPLNGDQGNGESKNRNDVKQANENLKKTIKFQSETICNLNKLFEAVKQQNDELNLELNQAFNHKVRSVLSTVADLNKNRENSVLDHERTKVIDDGIVLVTDIANRLTLENVETFSKVCFSSDALRRAQDSITSCEDKEKLKDLIHHRDIAKHELSANVKDFLEEVSSLDLDERECKLKEALSDLNFFHQPGERDDPLLEKAIDNYREWKTNLCNQVENVRNATDSTSSRLAGEFSKLQKLLDPAVNFSLDECGSIDVDSLALDFTDAVANEIQQTQVGEDRDGAEIVSALIGALKQEIEHEISDIIQLRTSAEEYTRLQKNMDKWLYGEPDVSKMWTIRKNLKNVKSKFRHRQADRKDLEEGDDSNDNENLKKVEDDLMELRLQLHELLNEEKIALEELACLAAEYFPELPLQYTEFGLQKFMATNGLVKQGWELTYYSHNEMTKVIPSSTSHVAFQTTFNGKPCVLKEFNLEGIGDVDLFESNAVAYSYVVHPNLLELHAFFYDKTNRKAFIQLPVYETNLKTWLGTSPPEKSKRIIFRDIVKALNSLHQAGITHGSVVMENIFVDSNTRGVLGEYCFVSDTQKRVASTAELLLKNAVPIACETSPEFDMYCLGEIACLVFFGEVPMIRDLNSVRKLCQDEDLTSMLQLLLALNGGSRPTARQIMDHPIFTDEKLFDTGKRNEAKPGTGALEEEEKPNEMSTEGETEKKQEKNEASYRNVNEAEEEKGTVVQEAEVALDEKTAQEGKPAQEETTREEKLIEEEKPAQEEIAVQEETTGEMTAQEEKVAQEKEEQDEKSVDIVNSEESKIKISPGEPTSVEKRVDDNGQQVAEQVDIPGDHGVPNQPSLESEKNE